MTHKTTGAQKTKQVLVRVSPELYDLIVEEAIKEGRPIGQYVRVLLEDCHGIDRLKKGKDQ